MEEYFKMLGKCVIILGIIWLLWTGICSGIMGMCQISVDKINNRCGTNYTASDYFWIGDNIRIMEK